MDAWEEVDRLAEADTIATATEATEAGAADSPTRKDHRTAPRLAEVVEVTEVEEAEEEVAVDVLTAQEEGQEAVLSTRAACPYRLRVAVAFHLPSPAVEQAPAHPPHHLDPRRVVVIVLRPVEDGEVDPSRACPVAVDSQEAQEGAATSKRRRSRRPKVLAILARKINPRRSASGGARRM